MMDDQTTEQLKSIVAIAPKSAVLVMTTDGGQSFFTDNEDLECAKTWIYINEELRECDISCEPIYALENHHRLSDITEIITLREANAELKKVISGFRKSELENDALVMANARRLIKANVRTSNGRLFSELFGTGCGTGRDLARKLGLDPDCNKTDYNKMRSYIDSQALKAGK
jgi:hypothetical protein